ncbi:rubredoxin-NAD(+) reductase [Pseudovirgaria hyperparasitica]|uniref:Rubredoxin-NAD(+) reductase n=1 Tax=Pseudovirgaria hyperparasitica TaxID=470096 RepID=A0A6A6W9Y2_9PEZI|nr:rubredoxin-NAD(+) reductase [Pseudovirgaria hyperparasitica]KAF2758760.1 rubredoxin-NAD(+) reductase [Pseudovirgaria hyperparasitica]
MAKEYKLKGIASIDLKNGDKIEAEVDGIEGGKVLLAKVQDKVHALSPKCTHYGAPLKNGILTPEGRLTCPWHGACFNVSTGDVEDAPALDPLAKYEIIEKDGGVYIKAEEATIKAARRTLNIKCSAKGTEKIVVVGGGSGTVGAIEGLRGGGFTGPITVISKEGYQPFDRTKLSKALLADISKVAWRSKEYYQESDIDIVSDEAESVDFTAKKVTTASGKSYDYTSLVLATGGTPRFLPLPGLKGDLGNVFVLREIKHVSDILAAVGDNNKKIAVVGSSFIGMEVANALVGKKNDVTVVGMESEPMERVMGAKVGAVFRGLLEKNGVKFKMGASVEKGTPSSSDSSKIGAVHLKDGTVLEADLVVEGVGVAPATEYLKNNSAITLEKDGSIKTNESFAVAGLENVYAIGDIATYPYHGPGGNGALTRIEHWNVAQNAGRSVAASISSPGSKPKPFIPVFWSALGAQLRYCGNTVGGYDDVIVQGDTSKPSFVAYYTSGETVVAVTSMGKDPYMAQSAELMRRNAMPSKSELAGGKDIMEVSVPSGIKI